MYESLIEATKFHATNEEHWVGEALAEYKHNIYEVIKNNNVKTILDYGCGKGRIVMYVKDTQPNTEVVGYDPGMEEYKTLPEGKFDFVWCTDVLEHIEPDLIENVLNHINELSSDYLYLCVNCSRAKKTLRDGRNAHLIIKPKEWWREHFVKMGNILKEEIRISKWGKQKEFESINYFVLLKK